MALTIHSREVDGVTVLDLSGRITLGEGSVQIRDAIRDLISNCLLYTSDRKAQVVADLAEVGPTMSMLGGWSGVTPDGSILAVRDISLEEIYSAELDLP